MVMVCRFEVDRGNGRDVPSNDSIGRARASFVSNFKSMKRCFYKKNHSIKVLLLSERFVFTKSTTESDNMEFHIKISLKNQQLYREIICISCT